MTPKKELNISKSQIREFLYRLAGDEGCQFTAVRWKCGGPEFAYAKKILNLMNIPEEEQEKLINFCKQHDGACDCEILMNTAPHLLGEETPW